MAIREKQEKFLFGCNYYPYYHTHEELKTDFSNMRKIGFNQTRTAEALTSWDRIEPQEGHYDWSFVDRLMDESARRNFTVVLGTGSSCPPHWLVTKYPDIQIVEKNNNKQHLLATYNWACIDHPGYQEAHGKYLKALINRYASHPALGYWQINNEPGYPFVQEQGSVNIYCYCDHSKRAFQRFLKNKYKTIEALNKSWQWLATNLWFNDWEDVEMPRTMPSAWGAISAWIDWHQFRCSSWTERFKDEAGIIKSMDSQHPILLNTFVYSRWDYFGLVLGVNLWHLAETVDIFGSDLYPGIGNRYKKEREYISNKFFLEKSIAKDKPLWVPELESGPIGGYAKGPDHTPAPRDIGRYMAESIGHGAKEISFHGWREWQPQPLHWGGLVNLEGEPTPSVEEVRKIITLVRDNEQLFLKSVVERQGVALLQTFDNGAVLQGYGADDLLTDSIRGFVDLLWSENYYVDFLDPDDVVDGIISDHIKVIILPYQLVIGEDLAAGLASFVHKGGTLIGTAKCGMMNQRGWYNTRLPGAGLDKVFGLREIAVHHCEDSRIVFGKKSFPAYHQKVVLEVYDNKKTDVIGEFLNESHEAFSMHSPAVTKTDFGSGCAWYFATHPGMSWLHGGRFSHIRDLIEKILSLAGVKRTAWLNEDKNREDIMDLHILEQEEQRVYIITNSTDSRLTAYLKTLHEHDEFLDMISGEVCGSGYSCPISLGPGEYIFLKSKVRTYKNNSEGETL